MQRLECFRRLTKWVIELGEYDIDFQPQQAIKGQALADFIVECTHEGESWSEEIKEWNMLMDGASNSQGSGAGVVLISPKGDILEYSL